MTQTPSGFTCWLSVTVHLGAEGNQEFSHTVWEPREPQVVLQSLLSASRVIISTFCSQTAGYEEHLPGSQARIREGSSTLASLHFLGDTLVLLPFEADSGKGPFAVHSSSAFVRTRGGPSSGETEVGRREPRSASPVLDLYSSHL